ncbi:MULTISPECIES: RIP metalloprotease RseP [unclassified Burkholderia]|uniref:RIP metalloprotease RseP n=1 Tax=unclassified Burkholderia TaxID=2613784 RepID=UPI0007585312|nr:MULTISPECIES: RIP metalloprotease RseP [unclassified Burkholderia]KVN01745.1 RIP metalloprotease RseP [Burkholderia sp. MSMB1552]KWZ56247.1 RIP metalloprotease RseP [Burkholderia sp. MSMB1588]
MNVLVELVAFAVAIGVLVVVHEYGHYRVARWCGVKVLRFSIGFGAPVARWVSKRTGTEWTLSALPLGGYVKMLDERDPGDGIRANELPHAFNRQPVGKRIAIVAAGPIANFLLAIALFSAVFATGVTEPAAIVAPPAAGTPAAVAGFDGGETIVSIRASGAGDAQGGDAEPVRSWSDLRWKLLGAAFDRKDVVLGARNRADGATYDFRVDLHGVSNRDIDDDFMSRLGFEPGGGSLTVTSVLPGGAAQQAGLQAGDKLVSLDGARIGGSTRFIDDVKAHAGRALALRIERAGVARTVSIVPQAQRDDETGKQVGRIGAALALQTPTVDVRYGAFESVELGVRRTWDISVYSLKMFGRMVTGEASLKNLSGPVTIADYAGKSARLGLSAFLSFLALVSISLGVLNLLPIPVLDGGHLLYYLVEAATGKAVSERWQLILQRAGLICIVALSAIALFNDLARLIHF